MLTSLLFLLLIGLLVLDKRDRRQRKVRHLERSLGAEAAAERGVEP